LRLWHKLTLVLVTLALLPLLLASWQIADRSAARLTDSIKAYHLATADVTLSEVRSMIARARGEALSVAALLTDRSIPAAERERLLRSRLSAFDLLAAVTIHDVRGQRVLHLGPAQIDEERLGAAVLASLGENPQALGRTRRTDGDAAPRRLLPLTLPLLEPDGQPLGYLRAWIDLDPLEGFVSQLSRRHFGEAGSRIRLIDEELKRLGGPPGSRAEDPDDLRDEPALGEVREQHHPFRRELAYAVDYEGLDGSAMIGVFVLIPELGWAVFVEDE